MTVPARVFAALLLAGTIAGAQQRPADDDKASLEDPWTKGDAAALEKLGYVHVGPMPWGDGHGTERIGEILGEERFRFVETAHFKLGSALPPLRMPRDKDAHRKLVEELTRLEEKLPDLHARRVRVLDPWLRTHLFAQRLEELYAQIEALLGVTDAEFPGPDAPFFRNRAPLGQEVDGARPVPRA